MGIFSKTDDVGESGEVVSDGENTVTETMKDDAPEEGDDSPEEVEITHLMNPDTGRIFEANETIMKQKLLVPCDKDGKRVYDNRRLGRLN